MTYEHIYILKNFYQELQIDKQCLLDFRSKLFNNVGRLELLRYINNQGNECWLKPSKYNDELLKDIKEVRTVYVRADKAANSLSEIEFLNRFKQTNDFHISFGESNFIRQSNLTHKIYSRILEALQLADAEVMFVLFNWTDPKLCGWHTDGMKSGKYFETEPTKCTINIPILNNGYIELMRSDGSCINNRQYSDELILFDSHKIRHRVLLESNTVRSTLAFRIINYKFEEIVDRLISSNSIIQIL